MTIEHLSAASFDEILSCFLAAFAGYFVEMPTDPVYYQQRWQAAKVDFNRSYGMFDQGKLVGFIIHAVDYRGGVLTAFNTGTGVIPAYRGQRIVPSIYTYARRDLERHGVKQVTLEVIRENEKAVRCYHSIGFTISKYYQCFAGKIQVENPGQFAVELIAPKDIDWLQLPDQMQYSWDFQQETIVKGNYSFYQVSHNQALESFFIINPENGYVAQFDLLTDDDQAWFRLFGAVSCVMEQIKVINVDERRVDKMDILRRIGLAQTIEQFEMRLPL